MKNTTLYERDAPSPDVVRRALAETKLGAFWLDDARAAGLDTGRPTLNGAMSADLVVVGGGFCGLWTAVIAKRRDPSRRVVLLEGRRIGWAASGRNGGWVDYSITHGAENGRRRWPDDFELLERLGMENLAGMERDVTELGVDAHFDRTGAIMLAVEEHQLEWTRDLENPGESTLSRERAQGLLNAPGLLGGILIDPSKVATVHPARLAFGLARAAEELGIEIFEHSVVRGLDTNGPGVIAVTDGGSVRAEQAALATNVFRPLLKRNRLMTVPVYDYVLMTEPLTAAQRESIGWAGRQGIGDLSNQFHYSQITRDGRILWGGYDAVYKSGGRIKESYEDDPAMHAKLASHFFALFPQLEGLAFSHRWAGVIDTSTRFSAFHGTARKGRVAYAAGFTGLGVAAVRYGAEVMLDLLAGERTERTENAMVRSRGVPFPPEPAATIGIQMSRWSLEQADHHQGRRNLFLKTMDALGLGFDS